MDEYIKTLIEQNPYMEEKCPNCKRKIKLKTKEVFKQNITNLPCPKCKTDLAIHTSQFQKGFIKFCKDIGLKPSK